MLEFSPPLILFWTFPGVSHFGSYLNTHVMVGEAHPRAVGLALPPVPVTFAPLHEGSGRRAGCRASPRDAPQRPARLPARPGRQERAPRAPLSLTPPHCAGGPHAGDLLGLPVWRCVPPGLSACVLIL